MTKVLFLHVVFSCGLWRFSGPPEFLNNSVQEQPSGSDGDQQMWRHGRRRNRRDKKDLPAGKISKDFHFTCGLKMVSACQNNFYPVES